MKYEIKIEKELDFSGWNVFWNSLAFLLGIILALLLLSFL